MYDISLGNLIFLCKEVSSGKGCKGYLYRDLLPSWLAFIKGLLRIQGRPSRRVPLYLKWYGSYVNAEFTV